MTAKLFPKFDGYQGIWFTLGQFSEYGDKYSGGLGTYTAKHVPLAVYSAEANKTFFVYGGAKEGEQHLLAMVSYYDHERHVVPRPTIVHDKGGVNDPHDNPSICLDEYGYIWIFVSGRGRHRPGYKYRSTEPYSIEAFEQITEEEITYPQPWWIQGKGFLSLFTKYTGVRELYWNTSPDGREWSDHTKLAGIEGHYQTSRQHGNRVITAFNMHPQGKPDLRTNLYYVETDDMGKTWRTADGTPVETPMTDKHCAALVRDFEAEGLLVYMKDINFDHDGHPVILVVTSKDHKPGPESGPRIWTIVHWLGDRWEFSEVTRSLHNYDMGSLYIAEDGTWRIIGPTEPGPQLHGTGGEMALWLSKDQGKKWKKERDITRNSSLNHAYARRPVNAHKDFYAFWADGNPDEISESRIYFTNQAGDKVFVLPYDMKEDFAVPKPLQSSSTRGEQETAPVFEMQDLFESVRIPNITVATDGTVLAFAKSGRLLRRSKDGGKTWTPAQEVGHDSGGSAIVDENSGDVMVFSARNAHLWRSRDHGKTWKREEVTIKPNASGHGTPDGVPVQTACSESGVTLRYGEHKGRLLMPARVMAPKGTNDQEWWPYHYNTAVYSDDGGKTWQTSGPVQSGTGEGTLAELSNGDIYYNSRSHMSVDHRRRIAWSYDGGDMFTDWQVSEHLYEIAQPHYFKYGRKPSYGCNAGLVRLPLEATGGKDVLLFSAPDNPGSSRIRMTVWASFDGGKTWPIKRLVYEGLSAYSSITAGRDGKIHLLFERGEEKLYETVAVACFNLDWLAEGQDWRKLLSD